MKKCTLLILLVLLSGPAQAHHEKGHQILIPNRELRRIDCGHVSNFVKKWEILQRMLNNHGKDISSEEYKELEMAKEIKANFCSEV